MITSERQLGVTQKKIEELNASIKKLEASSKPFAKASLVQTKSLVEELKQEIKSYKLLREKGLEAIELENLAEILTLPMKYRIAMNLTQDSFAKIVELPVRAIARYEAENYGNINAENFRKILSKLPVKMTGKLKGA